MANAEEAKQTLVEMGNTAAKSEVGLGQGSDGAPQRPKPGAHRRRLSPVGQGWKRGLYPTEMGMPQANISGLLTFKEAPPLTDIADAFEKKIWPRYRFKSLVVDMDFVEQEGPMDRAYHFQERQMSSMAAIDEYCFGVATVPLDENHPLWRVEVLRNSGGSDVMLLKLHHCLSDGLGVLFAFLPMLTLASGGDVLQSIPLPAGVKAMMTNPDGNKGDDSMKQMSSEERRLGCCRRRCRDNSSFWRGACSSLTMGHSSELKINPKLADRKPFLTYSGRHVFTKMPLVPNSLVKQVRAAHGCSFNDAIMAALSGAFRRYSIEKLDDPLFKNAASQVECKSWMLLALPRPITPSDPDAALCNNFVTPVLNLAVNEPTPKGRLDATVAACNEFKSRAYISGMYCITKTISGIAPVSVLKKALSEAISKLTANITSVPLPNEPMLFEGREVEAIQCIFVNNVPQISILSYNENLHWNMVSDPAFIAEPEAFGVYMLEEMEALTKA